MSRLVAHTERALVPARSGSNRHVHLVYEAPARGGDEPRLPMNLAFILDRSGSMDGDKIGLARLGTLEGVARLSPADRFAVVAYDSEVEVTVPSMPGGAEGLAVARERVGGIEPRGSTDLCSGWLTGCKEIARGLEKEHVARALLFTDGHANHGEQSHERLTHHAAELRARGIATSTFGIGLGYDENLLRAIADAGGGQCRYVEAPADLPRLLREELTDAMDVVHRSVVLRMEGPASVALEVIGPWPTRNVGDAVEVTIGDLVSEERLEIVVRAHMSAGPEGDAVTVRFSLHDRDGTLAEGSAECGWRYAAAEQNRDQPRDMAVDRVVASRHAARARETALGANGRRDYREAASRLNLVADRVARYAGTDPELLRIVASLRFDAQRYAHQLSEYDRKREYQESTSESRGKTGSGSALRMRR